jgi:amidohydrolase
MSRSDGSAAVKQAGLPPELIEKVWKLRRRLHQHPETAFEEKETARIIVEFLAEFGVEPLAEEIAGPGVLFRLKGGKPGPRVLLEADLDALPLEEATGVDYASKHDGKHHACGHDGHMAMVAGAMAHLAEGKDEFAGELYALFQPAEETGEGAEKAMQDPRLNRLELDGVFAIHNLPGHPMGTIVIRPGPMASASVGMHFRFEGETSHAAAPHKGKSATGAVAQLSLRAAGTPSEVLPYGRAALVTPIHMEVGRVAYGTAAGSGSARFTVRAAADEDLKKVKDRLVKKAEAMAMSHDLELTVEEVEPFPSTVNDPDCVAAVEAAAARLGLEVDRPDGALPWSEDFGHFNQKWPGALICLGSGEDQPELHRPDFDFPDDLLATGIAFWVELIRYGAGKALSDSKEGSE